MKHILANGCVQPVTSNNLSKSIAVTLLSALSAFLLYCPLACYNQLTLEEATARVSPRQPIPRVATASRVVLATPPPRAMVLTKAMTAQADVQVRSMRKALTEGI